MGTATIAGLVVLDAEFLIHKGGMGTRPGRGADELSGEFLIH